MALAITKGLMDVQPLKVKFFTAAYSFEVDTYLNEEIEKFLNQDLTKFRSLGGTPAVFISSGKDILIAVTYKELSLSDNEIVDYIEGMDEEEVKLYSNWEETIKRLRNKGVKISVK